MGVIAMVRIDDDNGLPALLHTAPRARSKPPRESRTGSIMGTNPDRASIGAASRTVMSSNCFPGEIGMIHLPLGPCQHQLAA
jgi:hypothetical protein